MIDRPCPVADRLDEVMHGSFCRACAEHVIDLDALTAPARLRLLAGITGRACVRYRRPAAAALSAVVLASGAGALPAAAQQDRPGAAVAPVTALKPGPVTAQVITENAGANIIVGGISACPPHLSAAMQREARRLEREQRRQERLAHHAPAD